MYETYKQLTSTLTPVKKGRMILHCTFSIKQNMVREFLKERSVYTASPPQCLRHTETVKRTKNPPLRYRANNGTHNEKARFR